MERILKVARQSGTLNLSGKDLRYDGKSSRLFSGMSNTPEQCSGDVAHFSCIDHHIHFIRKVVYIFSPLASLFFPDKTSFLFDDVQLCS